MFPVINLGPVAVQAPGLILLISVWLAITLVERRAKQAGDTSETLSGLVFTALISGLIGARLWYAIRFLDVYLADPIGLVAFNTSAFDLTGGLLFGLAAGFIYTVRKNLPLRPTLDRLTPGAALVAVGLGLAHLAGGDAYGAPTTVPWGIFLWEATRHPAQLYEMGLAGLVLAAVWKLAPANPFPGFLFLAFIALTAAARLFLEAFRGDSVIVAGSIRQPQLAALLVLLAALWMMRQWAPRPV